jgi:large subunit ribosomal protein L17
VLHGRIETTEAKAKSIKPLADKMVTLGKRGDLAARRQAAAFLLDPAAVRKLFDDVAPRYAERNGGYTRIIKTGVRRGDAAPMAIVEWV